MIYLLLFILLTLASWIGLAQIFKKAGVEQWKAFVPILNWLEWLKLIGKPWWWVLLLFVPIVGLFYWAYMHVGLAKSFKHYGFWHHAAAVLGFFVYLPFLGFSNKETYYGPDGLRPGEHLPQVSGLRSWVDSVIFAIVAAHLIRIFFIEAFKIPTSSMEPTLQIGDYMFVSKAHYGSRIPNTPLSLPLIHHTIPFTKARAYSEAIKLDYFRFPGITEIKRNDIAVFNVPFEYDMQSPLTKRYYQGIKYKSRPVDKREHYIKRIVGMPGDTLLIRDDQVYINGQPAENPELLQFHYRAQTNKTLSLQDWRNLGVRAYYNYYNRSKNPVEINRNNPNQVQLATTPTVAKALNENPVVDTLVSVDYTNSAMKYATGFPQDSNIRGWTVADYGPIVIPKKGMTIALTPENFEIYKEAIGVHEHNEIGTDGKQFTINGEQTNHYTFKMDYYWLMGDNRHSSLDSRSWGFVPEDHIVGKPLFIFFSSQGGEGNPGIRWNRILKRAQDMN